MTSESHRKWPRFESELVDWESTDTGYGPRRARTAFTGPYHASIPSVIADASVDLPARAVALIEEASSEIARFDGESLGSTTSFAALLLRTEAASSSQIEDLTSSPKAIALAELGRTGRANAEAIVGNVTAMTAALELAEDLSSGAILRMHEVLTRHRTDAHAGMLRQEPVWIGGSSRGPHGADYVAPRHERVPAALADLTDFIRRDDVPVLAQAAITHAQFENIHPFTDGNGRTGRALLHAMIRHGGLATRSIVPLSAGLLADTDSYFAALAAYRDGDPVSIIIEVGESVFPALANSRQMIEEIRTARASWEEKISARRDASAWRLADLLTTRPVVDARFAADRLGVTGANAQLAIDRLVEDGVLSQIGNGRRNRAWQADEILDAMERFAVRVRRRT
ncbi:MAG: Fic family protein [Actinomycetales bacterium]|nr:Fic family protein [Actinomycetales bacterium]